jgi:hypothetical protein
MKSFFLNRLVLPLTSGLANGMYSLQHLLMKAAVAFSLKLCLFTARVLLNADDRPQQRASQSF